MTDNTDQVLATKQKVEGMGLNLIKFAPNLTRSGALNFMINLRLGTRISLSPSALNFKFKTVRKDRSVPR